MSSGPGAGSAPASLTENDKVSTFGSFQVRNYRIHFFGNAISNIGTWMQRIAQDWLVHELTGSAAAVGVTLALQFLPMLLFGLYGGVLADRFDKRMLLIGTQAVLGVTGLSLAALTFTGVVNVYHVYALALVVGLVTVVDNPARQTFVSDMVGPRLLRNAVSLNSANFQSARLIGPAVAGVLIAAVGGAWAFLINGLSFVAPIIGLLMMRTSELTRAERVPRGRGQLREGLRYVGGRPDLLWVIVLVGFIGTFGYNFAIWLVAFTDQVFASGAGTYGLLNSLMAAGSVIGALLAARRGSSRIRFTVAAAAVFAVLLVVASAAPNFLTFALLMPLIGLAGMTFQVTANSTVQISTDPAMRGRVISLFMMVFVGGTPFGGPLVGWLSDAFGARIGLLGGAVVCLAAAVGVAMMLARVGGLRLRISLRAGRRGVAFVPREESREAPAPAGAAVRPAA
ncbi:MFS transporter [Streptomyces sp. DSM 44915]|uniref:MFS transporter n=1 Tax=Streptomyces chisholmiae TaxID=3075540 RepID=A0ABU2JUH4_9ACTN|nr:MFS transporter [Streptomyces sp. DSM 44915]MDT0268174.1 MFS transporter [Streptomyces sp. DSM 44915]